MVDVLFDESALVLTGIFITFLSSFLYTINDHGFISRGRYRKKEEAIFIFVGATMFLGLLTPFINELSKMILRSVPILSIIGIILIGSNFVLHYSIPRWNQMSTKSLLIYLLGGFLLVSGFLFSLYLL